MLLPSAISCDSSSQGSKPRYQPALFASPPLSPPPSSSSLSTIPNLYSTCRALQSMLTAPSQLPSPPTTHATIPAPAPAPAPASPFRLRLRTRRDEPPATAPPRKKITKRTAHAPPPRGPNKRRRATDVEPEDAEEDLERSAGEPEADMTDSASEDNNDSSSSSRPRTPKRMRTAPEVLPLGLERADFDALRGTEATEREEWTTEEDRVLVELVLEKLKLTKSDWQDCARSLGKDRGSVGRRWKSLMCAGEVGLKTRSRRGRIHGTWR